MNNNSIFIIALIIGVTVFWWGMHNFDVGHNMHWLNAEYGLDIQDDGMAWDEQVLIGFTEMIVGGFIICIALVCAERT